MKLSDAGITLSQLGHLERFGFGHSRTAPMEISYNGKALRLARWPNDGSYVNVESTPDGREGKRFTYPSSLGSRAEKWRHENDLWVYGFWYWSWADDSAKIASVDPAHHTMTLGSELHYGMRTGHIQSGNHAGYSQQGGYFHVFNALSELDQGGEYYIDRKSGILYIYPPTQHGDLSHHDVVYASLLNNLFELSHLSHFHISDLILDGSRHYGILGQSLSSCSFDRLEIRNTGSYGMHLSGSNILVRQCDIHDTDGGISISGK
ncbi:uncharacterized protein LOC135477058 [Liolophura sinensis]|uniref:uncharacterized protein LOC135477058 n=1 Tax=Liolophura sinensis TaxID=3198878 RepID=UPI003158207A